MVFILILSAVTALFCIFTVKLRRSGKSFEGMVCKFFSSFGFMSIAFIGFSHNMRNPLYFTLVVFGLLFGLGGDVFLGIKEIAPKYKNRLIIIGTLCFLICHIFYLSSFLAALPTYSIIPVFVALGITILGAVLIKVVKMQLKTPMYIGVVVYLFILTLCATVCGHVYITTWSFSFFLALLASMLLLVSDVILSFVYFTPMKRKNKLVTAELITYYSGQILMAVTVYTMI